MKRPPPNLSSCDRSARSRVPGLVSRRDLLRGLALTGAAGLLPGCGPGTRALSLLCWGDYVSRALVERFERESGARIIEDVFLAEAEMVARLRAGGAYDVAATIDYMLSTLQREDLLRTLPTDLAGLEHLDDEHPPWRARADRGGGLYAVPYLWGTTGIGYDADKVGDVESWAALFDERWAGRISVLDSKGDVFDQALLAAGMDINSTDKPRLRDEILPALLRQKRLLRGYDSDPARALVSGETWIAQIDSGDLLRARRLKPSLRYVIPREGAASWTDYLVIPAATRDFDLAQRFLEFTLDPSIAAANANELCFATPNRTALAGGLVEQADDPMIYPPDEVRARLFESENWAGNTGRVVEELWLELRTTSG